MITAYLLGMPSYYEGEDIEIRFCVFKEGALLFKEASFKEYKKPVIVEHMALLALLKRLEEFKEKEITIIINNASVYEQIRGTSTLKNKDAMRMINKVKGKLDEFGNHLIIEDVSNDKIGLKNWKETLEETFI
ncbi:reverse transcriptase-like protein [Marinisporobacter balticus]|uniref:Reverse transcriptase-like protein n=1 Tax=Marinisporobacter balticus TaxID=2018667 RepID=A0A4R2KMK7_9FIRM|nr:reverse transcriptase-like protein [Marinisporobacter balticus]TCO74933.1 hypothetical protein EV214_1104 [Marinisporobacter balticus]